MQPNTPKAYSYDQKRLLVLVPQVFNQPYNSLEIIVPLPHTPPLKTAANIFSSFPEEKKCLFFGKELLLLSNTTCQCPDLRVGKHHKLVPLFTTTSYLMNTQTKGVSTPVFLEGMRDTTFKHFVRFFLSLFSLSLSLHFFGEERKRKKQHFFWGRQKGKHLCFGGERGNLLLFAVGNLILIKVERGVAVYSS